MASIMSSGNIAMSKLHFERKAMPVFPDHRPLYKICQILLILDLCSAGNKSSLIRLHLFNWALKDLKRMEMLILSAKTKIISFGVWGMDPALNMALNMAVAEGLINKTLTGYGLSVKGKDFIRQGDIKNLFSVDCQSLNLIGKKITEKMVKDVANRWKNEI